MRRNIFPLCVAVSIAFASWSSCSAQELGVTREERGYSDGYNHPGLAPSANGDPDYSLGFQRGRDERGYDDDEDGARMGMPLGSGAKSLFKNSAQKVD